MPTDSRSLLEGESIESMTTKGLRMSATYAAWINDFAASERMGVATLIDRAVAEAAKRAGFRPPPERLP